MVCGFSYWHVSFSLCADGSKVESARSSVIARVLRPCLSNATTLSCVRRAQGFASTPCCVKARRDGLSAPPNVDCAYAFGSSLGRLDLGLTCGPCVDLVMWGRGELREPGSAEATLKQKEETFKGSLELGRNLRAKNHEACESCSRRKVRARRAVNWHAVDRGRVIDRARTSCMPATLDGRAGRDNGGRSKASSGIYEFAGTRARCTCLCEEVQQTRSVNRSWR